MTRTVYEVQDSNRTAMRTIAGESVAAVAQLVFGRGGRTVTVRAEGHGTWAVVTPIGEHGEGVIGRIKPVGRIEETPAVTATIRVQDVAPGTVVRHEGADKTVTAVERRGDAVRLTLDDGRHINRPWGGPVVPSAAPAAGIDVPAVLAAFDALPDDQRAALRAGVTSRNVKAWVEAMGMSWADWRALSVPFRDVITLHVYRSK